MKTIIKRVDGGVSMATLKNKNDLSEVIRKWCNEHPGQYVSHRDMEDAAIPTDRSFRKAWADTTPEPVIDIDIAKARQIHLNRIRMKRDAELADLDIEYLKAIEKGDADLLTKISARRQHLRDIPQNILSDIEAAETIDELKRIVPL